jgi:IclR family transcriptional regulator, pca regulon regulatory protein
MRIAAFEIAIDHLLDIGPPEKTQPSLQRIEFKRLNEKTITSLQQFLRELEQVREVGYALSDEEVAMGNRSIAAPLMDGNGYALAAIAIATPSENYTVARLKNELAPLLIACAQKISGALMQIRPKTGMM